MKLLLSWAAIAAAFFWLCYEMPGAYTEPTAPHVAEAQISDFLHRAKYPVKKVRNKKDRKPVYAASRG